MPLQIVISDSSVIIDLAKAGLVEAAFALPYDFRIPDVMFEDELIDLGDYDREDLLNAGLTKSTLDGSGVELAFKFGETYLSLSTNDQFALARHNDCLHTQEFSSNLCPCQSGDKSDLVFCFSLSMPEFIGTEKFFNCF